MEMPQATSGPRVAVIGAGHVGSTFAYALLHAGCAAELLMVDRDPRRAEGEAMDLSHGLPFLPPARVRAVASADVRDVDLIVMAAGAFTRPGETRLDLLSRNVDIIRQEVPPLAARNPEAVFLIITNPVDVLTEVAAREAGLPWGRVLGSGTVLDSARFRAALAARCGVAAHHVHAWVIGEHGDSEVPLWSTAMLGGARLAAAWPPAGDGPCPPEVMGEITREVREAAYQIVERKGATHYGIGLSAALISRAILRDERALLTVSIPEPGATGSVAFSVPCIVGRAGVLRLSPLTLTAAEATALGASRQLLADLIAKLELPPRPF